MADWKSTAKLGVGELDLVQHIHDYGLNLKTNEIYVTPIITGENIGDEEPGVDHSMATRFIMNLNLCRTVNPGSPVVLHLKSCGGDWSEGMAMFDAILTYPFHVTVINYTHSRSMSSMIPLAATKKVMMPNSTFMFHEGYYADDSTMREVRSNVEFYNRVASKTMLDIYYRRLCQRGCFKDYSEKKLKNLLQREMEKKENVYLTADETVEWGFYDEVFNGDWDNLTSYTQQQMQDAEEYGRFFLENINED